MAGINAISGIKPLSGSSGIASTGIGKPSAGKSNFADTLRNYVGKVDQQQRNAGSAIHDLVSGKSQDILPVVTAVAKADMSFKLLVGVRNKVIEAYKQTMNMQI